MSLESVLPSILSLVFGRWSDKYGRKLPLLMSLVGMVLCYTAYLTLTYFPSFCSSHLWVLILPSLPVAFGGNIPVFMMASFAYLGDTFVLKQSTNKGKLYQYLICEACCAFGAPIGVYVGGQLFHRYGHGIVFLTAATMEFVATIYCLIRLKNNTTELAKRKIATDKQYIKDDELSNCPDNDNSCITFFKKMFKASFRQREGQLRSILLIMVLCQAIATANYNLGSAMDYIYIKYKLNWSLQLFSEWKASYIAVAALGAVVIAPVLAHWISEPLQASVAFFLCGTFTFLLGLVRSCNSWMIWMALFLPCLFLVPTSVARTIVTRIATVNELGSVFGLMSFIGGVTPIIMSTLGTKMFDYAVSVSINVGIVYFFASSLHLIGFCLSLYTDFLWWNNKKLIM